MKELLDLNSDELKKMRGDLQNKIMLFRFKSKIEPPKNFMEKREMKKTVSRINTILTQYEKNGEAPVAVTNTKKK
jgi:ribosomal protein L29